MESRAHRFAIALLLVGAAIYLFKFALIALVGSEETWAQNVEGLSFVLGTPLQLIGLGMATWLATRGTPRAVGPVSQPRSSSFSGGSC